MEKKTNTLNKTTTSKSGSTNGKSSSANGKSAVAKNNGEQRTDSMLKEFFHDGIKDIYWAEKHLVKTLPKMIKASTTTELQSAIGEHLEVTKVHVERLEQVFGLLGQKPIAKKCDAMEGLTKEGESIVEDTEEGTATRDVGVILASQKIEHYEIATYGGLCQLAKTLGHDDIAEILATTLEEEKTADKSLTAIAENDINYQASEEMES